MLVNQIPSLTWNWLRMNVSEAEGFTPGKSGHPELEIPAGVEARSAKSFSNPDIVTGMGEDMTRLVIDSGAAISQLIVPSGNKVPDTLRMSLHFEDDDKSVSGTDIILGDDSSLTCAAIIDSPADASGDAAVQVRYEIGKNSKLKLIIVTHMGDKFNSFIDLGGKCDDGGRFELVEIILGGHDTYLGNFTDLYGKKSSLKTSLAYLLGHDAKLDVNYVSSHKGRKTDCDIRANGVLRDNAKKIFRGTIDFVKGCAGSTGNEYENVLLMDEDVVNKTIPVILCAEEDVEGNHGATIGKLPEDLMFYITSRGMDVESVYEMMARARIDSIANEINDSVTREAVDEYLDN